MNGKKKFHKVYINPALGYWKDYSKKEELVIDTLSPINPAFIMDEAHLYFNSMQVTRDITDHLCIGKRCLICETRNLVNPFEE